MELCAAEEDDNDEAIEPIEVVAAAPVSTLFYSEQGLGIISLELA